jgi:hypothetical protein
MNRRDLIALVGGAAAAWPVAARAQQPAMPVVGSAPISSALRALYCCGSSPQMGNSEKAMFSRRNKNN